jgi:hypothetical protein
MSIEVDTSFGNPDPALKFTTLQNLVTLLNQLVSSTIATVLTPYVLSSSTPSVQDQDKIWHRLDMAGRYVGVYKFYAGLWVPPTPPPGSRIGLFAGDPTTNFDATGKGLPGPGPVAMDYWGWALNNGQNGTANLSDRFIICARVDNSGITGWDSGTQLWRTNITGAPLTEGGSATITLDAATTFQPATTATTAAHYMADGNTRDAGGGMWGHDAGDGTGAPFDLIPADPGNTAPDPISVVNPFYAVAYISWIGY